LKLDAHTGFLRRDDFLQAANEARVQTDDHSTLLLLEVKTDELEAIETLAGILRRSFRGNDLLGRISRKRFAVLVFHSQPLKPGSMTERIEAKLQECGNPGIEVAMVSSTFGAGDLGEPKVLLRRLEKLLVAEY